MITTDCYMLTIVFMLKQHKISSPTSSSFDQAAGGCQAPRETRSCRWSGLEAWTWPRTNREFDVWFNRKLQFGWKILKSQTQTQYNSLFTSLNLKNSMTVCVRRTWHHPKLFHKSDWKMVNPILWCTKLLPYIQYYGADPNSWYITSPLLD